MLPEVKIGAINLQAGLRDGVSVPNVITKPVFSRFVKLLNELGTRWEADEIGPVSIPVKPNREYYQSFAFGFARSYFNKNLLKCLIATEILRHHLPFNCDYYDLGGGSGAFAVALMSSGHAKSVKIIDYSEHQLKLASRIAKNLSYDDSIMLNNSNINDFDSFDKNCIASYVFCEAMQEDYDIIQKVERSKSFILLDSPALISNVDNYLRARNVHTFSRQVEFVVDDKLRPFVEGGGGHFSFLFKGENKRKL